VSVLGWSASELLFESGESCTVRDCVFVEFEFLKRNVSICHVVLCRKIFGQLDGLDMVACERVRWYLMSKGTASHSVHVVQWHGATVVGASGLRSDSVPVISGQHRVADMVPVLDGVYEIECGLMLEADTGMTALFSVNATQQCGLSIPVSPFAREREYYIQGGKCHIG
jgi:hypothetical protein